MEKTADMQDKILQMSKDVVLIVKQATSIQIEKTEDMEPATEFLKQVVARKKRFEELRLFFTKPLNDHIKQVNAEFKNLSVPLEDIERDVKNKMVAFRKIEQEKIFKEQEKLLAKAETMKTEKKQEEYREKAEEIKQETKIESKSGEVRFRKVWKFEITDETSIPREYLKVDETSIRQAISSGLREINGVRIFEEEIPSSY